MNLEAFLKIEKKFGLIEDKLNGFAYWSYFRYDLEWELEVCKNTYGEAHMRPALSVLERMKVRIGTLWYAFANHMLPKGKHDVLILNHERRVWDSDYFECIYTDQIAQLYHGSVVLERPYLQKHLSPVRTENLVYTDYVEAKAMIYYLWHRNMRTKQYLNIRQLLQQKISRPVEEICGEYGIDYGMESILDKMTCGYYIYQVKKKEFGKILRRLDPKVIIEVVGYNMDCMIMNELAIEFDIPTIELQHGTTGEEHIAYNYPDNVKAEQFPQYFFAFSQFWIDAARFPLPKEHLKAVGFPHLESKAKNAMRTTTKVGPRKIIFISQGTIGELLVELAVRLNQLIDHEQYEIIYKLHPGEYVGWKERYIKLSTSGINVADNNSVDLYSLFAMSDYQIGAYGSTATFEGLYFNLKTYILKEKASSELKMLCDRGLAVFFDTAEELYQLICGDNGEQTESLIFWNENALENMKKEIDKIMHLKEA